MIEELKYYMHMGNGKTLWIAKETFDNDMKHLLPREDCSIIWIVEVPGKCFFHIRNKHTAPTISKYRS